MSEEESGSCVMGKVVIGCFMTVWSGTAFGMAYLALEQGAPLIFPLAAGGMGAIGVVFCIALMKGMSPASPSSRARTVGMTYSGDEFIPRSSYPISREEKALYQVPSVCPSCLASISTEEVDWVGPLQAKCPYCGATIDAEKKIL
ncbi:MAG: hypothetical protein ACP6KW_01530 [Candidatus Thorarchaeota archaeon]